MAVFAGWSSIGEARIEPTAPSSRLDDFAVPLYTPVQPIVTLSAWATKHGTGAVTLAPHAGKVGHFSPGFGGELFEKVIVIPRVKPLGFVLSEVIFSTEVWNTFRARARVLTSIDVTGFGEIEVVNPFTLPKTFWPFHAETFSTIVPQDGAVAIDSLVDFVFTGVAGTDLHITGSRLAVFAPEIDWSKGFVERITYLTSVLTGFSDAEQRIQNRTVPRRGATFRVFAVNEREAGSLRALLWARKSRLFGVPWWCDAQRIDAPAAPGDLVLALDTTDRTFEIGGLVVVWKDQFTYEALTIEDIDASSITLSTAITKSWPVIGTRVVPLRRGRLLDKATVVSPAFGTAAIDVAFTTETV